MLNRKHKSIYQIEHDFQVKQAHVLQLNSDYDFGNFNRAVIEGKSYKFTLNSIRSWIILLNADYKEDSLKGKIVEFIKYTDETNERIAV